MYVCVCAERNAGKWTRLDRRALTAELRLRAEFLGDPRRAPLPTPDGRSPCRHSRVVDRRERANAGFTRSENDGCKMSNFYGL